MNKIIKKMLTICLAISLFMGIGVCAYAEPGDVVCYIYNDVEGQTGDISNYKDKWMDLTSYTEFVPYGRAIHIGVDNYSNKTVKITDDDNNEFKVKANTYKEFKVTEKYDAYITFTIKDYKITVHSKPVNPTDAKSDNTNVKKDNSASNDDALAQYYAALEKQQKKANKDTKDSKAELSQEELLAQYYAALEKQQKKK